MFVETVFRHKRIWHGFLDWQEKEAAASQNAD